MKLKHLLTLAVCTAAIGQNSELHAANNPVQVHYVQYTPNPVKVGTAQTFKFQYSNAKTCKGYSRLVPNGLTYFDHGNSVKSDTFIWPSPPRTSADIGNLTVRVVCEGADSSIDFKEVTRIVEPRVETPNISWDVPSKAYAGVTFYISWTTQHANICDFSDNDGATWKNVPLHHNNYPVTLHQSNILVLNCKGNGGSSERRKPVTVEQLNFGNLN